MSSSYFKLRILKRMRLKNLKDTNCSAFSNEIHKTSEFAIQNKCRVCLKEGTISIYSVKKPFDISEAIKIFADIEINEDDGFPGFLCASCYSLLQGAVLLRKSAKLSDTLLKREYCNVIEVENDECDQSDYPINEENVQRSYSLPNEYIGHKDSKTHKNVRIQCPICQGIYTSKSYSKHIAFHKSASHLICEVCGKLYRKDNLLRHLQLHNYDLPYQCKVCPYRGRFLESLKIHTRTHTGDKPFACDKCMLQFSTRSNLNRHLLIHNREKPFKCIECNRGFYTKRELDAHFKSDHAGFKDFLCKLCGNKYGTRKALMRHELRVHKRTKFAKGRIPLYLQTEFKITES